MSKGWVSYIRTYGIVVFLPLALGACRPKVATSSLGEVYLPDHLTSPRERLGYLIDHYWDKMEAQPDTSQALIARQIEDFCGLLHGVPLGTARRGISRSLNFLSGEALQTALTTYRSQLYDPESPHYNEGLYSLVLSWEESSMKVDSAQKVAAYLQRVRLQHNAIGRTAQDFLYHTSDTTGTVSRRLSHFNAPYTLLVLSVDSDKRNQQWAEALHLHKALYRLVQERNLRPLVVYTGATRPDSALRSLWSGATLGYDSAQLITAQRRYDLSHGSALYLLDAKKTVLLRNTSIPKIATYLHARDEE